jgi:transposase-like protein
MHSLCLECPYSRCLEEKPRGKQRMSLKLRAIAMRKMRRSGNGVRTVAKAFGVSIRTVQREMKRRIALLMIASVLYAWQ